MRHGAGAVTHWWMVPPPRQVTYLIGVDPELLGVALDPLPPDAPAVVRFRPTVGVSPAAQVAVLLDELDRAAIALFPRWLPGAEGLDGPHALGIVAVRTLAARSAARSNNFGPFLAELAERGLRGAGTDPVGDAPVHGPVGRRSRFPAEVRAAGLARIVANAYGRTSAVLLIEVPDGLTPVDERALTAVAEWLVQHGRFTVWLAGAPLRVVDRVLHVPVRLPEHLTHLTVDARQVGATPAATGTPGGPGPGPALTYPPLTGLPRADSPAEQALERALAAHDWAHGRRWNHVHELHTLGRPYRLDLLWAAEGLVVEVDGPEHRGLIKFADDRQRDVRLQLAGYDVLRFTNEQVMADVHAVVWQIGLLLARRRAAGGHDGEKGHDVDRGNGSESDAESDQRTRGTDGRGA